MLCKYPFVRKPDGKIVKQVLAGEDFLDATPFPCGQCLPCRINRRRVWTARLLLELASHRTAAFVTLTYSPDHLPAQGSLVRKHLQLFIKRLRSKLYPRRIRYYACGEYGGQTGRAHYHVLLYSVDPLADDHAIRESWSYGLVHIGAVEPDSIQYVAGYVTKKLVKKRSDYDDLGIIPEFSLMSLKPAIGTQVVEPLSRLVKSHPEYFDSPTPTIIRIGGKKYPLGRTLQKKLREAVGVSQEQHLLSYMKSSLEVEKAAQEAGDYSVLEYIAREYEPKRARLSKKLSLRRRGL